MENDRGSVKGAVGGRGRAAIGGVADGGTAGGAGDRNLESGRKINAGWRRKDWSGHLHVRNRNWIGEPRAFKQRALAKRRSRDEHEATEQRRGGEGVMVMHRFSSFPGERFRGWFGWNQKVH